MLLNVNTHFPHLLRNKRPNVPKPFPAGWAVVSLGLVYTVLADEVTILALLHGHLGRWQAQACRADQLQQSPRLQSQNE